MRSLKLVLLATAATAVLSSAAFAADLIVDTPTAPVVDNSFNWDGAYIGALLQGQSNPSAIGVGIDFGANAVMNNLLIGGDVEGVLSTGGNASAQFTGKIGGVIGDSAILYAYSGLGTRTVTSFYVPVGVGIEFGIAQNVGIKAEAQYNFDVNHAFQNSAAVKVGLNWHF